MRLVIASVVGLGLCAAGLCIATQSVAVIFGYQAALGPPALRFGSAAAYWPWQAIVWDRRWGDHHPRPFALARFIELVGVVAGAIAAAAIARPRFTIKPFARGAWAKFADACSAGLFARGGVVLGKLDGEILCYDGPEHQILIGASRSGKGRGHVVPTLLAWPSSTLVLDVKGELADGDARVGFPGVAGYRARLGPVLRLAPTRPESAAFNPLFEVRRGPNEVRDVQNIVEILVDPAGDARHQDFWDRSAKQILVGVILHVLYAEPLARKTLAVVREKLRDLEITAQAMKGTLHRLSPVTGAPEVHPEARHAAESFLAGEARLQSGVKATAESFLGIFADEIVASRTATSDFRIGDLMCGERPVTLFLQPPPSDAARLTPLLRLFINQIARSLMEAQGTDAQGRAKRQRLLLLLDEFPTLGRMPFFETMMGAMAGYGLKAFLVCQSLNHVIRAYGRDNVILDNCHIVTSFAAADTDTAKRVADMAGEVWELRDSQTHKRPRPVFGWAGGSTTTREERRPLLLPADVRALPADEQLIFVSGCKPLRARKLRFDEEPVFRNRLALAAPSPAPTRLTTEHDWIDVHPLGVLPAPSPAARRARPAMSKPLTEQPDLFTQAATRGTRVSDRASAGFRDAQGAPLPHPSSLPETPVEHTEPRPSRAKGI